MREETKWRRHLSHKSIYPPDKHTPTTILQCINFLWKLSRINTFNSNKYVYLMMYLSVPIVIQNIAYKKNTYLFFNHRMNNSRNYNEDEKKSKQNKHKNFVPNNLFLYLTVQKKKKKSIVNAYISSH